MIRGVVEHGVVRLLEAVPGEWPEGQEIRIVPVRVSVPAPESQKKRGRSAEEVHRLLNFQGPAPDDETVERWVDEHRMQKYGQ